MTQQRRRSFPCFEGFENETPSDAAAASCRPYLLHRTVSGELHSTRILGLVEDCNQNTLLQKGSFRFEVTPGKRKK